MPNPLIDTSKQEKILKKDERKRNRELSDIRFVLLSPEGRRFYWRVMEKGGVFRDAKTNDPHETYFQLGKQSISRDFLNDLLDAKPTALAQLQDEHASELESERRQEEEDAKKSDTLT